MGHSEGMDLNDLVWYLFQSNIRNVAVYFPSDATSKINQRSPNNDGAASSLPSQGSYGIGDAPGAARGKHHERKALQSREARDLPPSEAVSTRRKLRDNRIDRYIAKAQFN